MNRKPGDWDCRSCQHLNFSRRDSCQRCGEPRSSGDRGGGDYASFGGGMRGAGGGSSFGFGGSDVRPGDWYCSCGSHNFANRSNCFRCGAFKDESAPAAPGFDQGGDAPPRRGYGFGGSGSGGGGGGGAGRAGWMSGDWICTRSGCNEHNFANRMECFRCNAPRDSGTEG